MSSPLSAPSPPPLKRRRASPPSPHRTLAYGTPLSPPPTSADSRETKKTRLRIYSWNINGIQPFIPPSTPQITNFFASKSGSDTTQSQPSLRVNFWRWQWPHIVFLQEVKIAPNDVKTPARLSRIVNDPLEEEEANLPTDQFYDSYLCLPRDKYNATGFGGKVHGVCTLIRRDLSPHSTTKTVDWDLEGRVQVVEIPRCRLIVINVYAVNGTTYDYRDPKTGKVIGDRHDRKRVFHTLLAQEVRAHEEKGWGVVVAGDINISRSEIDSYPQLRLGEDHVKNRADFEDKFINGLGMLDTFRLLHGEAQKYSYRPTSKPWGTGGDRVDMILVTKGLKIHVKQADILDSQAERGPSDHVPLFVSIETNSSKEISLIND